MDGRVRRSLVVRLWLGNISEGLIPSVSGVRVSHKLMNPSATRRYAFGGVAMDHTLHARPQPTNERTFMGICQMGQVSHHIGQAETTAKTREGGFC